MCIFTKGNVFTPVCHSVHRGVSVQQGLCPGGLCLEGEGHGLGGSLSRWSLSKGVSV